MQYDDMRSKRKHKLKHISVCPKCGNTDHIMSIPGTGRTYYFCPMCYKNKNKNKKES